ncbi:cadherin-17 [Menidia menidia]
MIMPPVVHLLLLQILFIIAGAKDLEEKKGPFVNTVLDVPEQTPVNYPVYKFEVKHTGVDDFRLSGEGKDDIRMTKDGWLFLEKPLDWSRDNHYIIKVEALAGNEVVDGPVYVTINVLDVNNNAPRFNQSSYAALVKERNRAGVPFTRVFASDKDDPDTPNALLSYSLISQTPNHHNVLLFQIDPNTGEISTTEEGEKTLKADEDIVYGRGEDRTIDTLKAKFDEYCPVPKVPHEENPFFSCVEKAEKRRQNKDPLEDPDYTLFVRVQDLGGASDKALSGTTRVNIVVQRNLWSSPGPITVQENLKVAYPHVIAKVQSNNPDAIYTLAQKERGMKFPFQIKENGEILLTEELDREEKDMYILVVFAKDQFENDVDPPMEIQILVGDVNDNKPVCDDEKNMLEVQENEPLGTEVGWVHAYDDDKEGTLNSQLAYTILSQSPPAEETFSVEEATGRIQALRLLQRKEHQVYNLDVRVSDSEFSVVCKVSIKVIDVNNELPLFEKNDYGSHTLAEDSPIGHTVLTIKATDADDPDSGSSRIEFHISAGDDNEAFKVETNGTGVGHLVIVKPLDFESSPTYNLKIDARNPEPLMKDLFYGSESSTVVSLSLTDVDEVPDFSLDILEVNVPENTTKGSVLLTVEANDPEGKEISFKLDGDSQGWLEINGATGEVKTKNKLDREKVESFDVTITAFEKANPEKSSERVLHVNLLDVNDNIPKLIETTAFICIKDLKPVIIMARDGDSAPFSEPFTFTFADSKKSPNWELRKVDGTSAELRLKKKPVQEKTFPLNINIKDNAGVGVTQVFEVKVCNCTELGHCYMSPEGVGFKPGLGTTIGVLAGILGFCAIVFIIVIKRSNKPRKDGLTEEGDAMM